MEYFSTQTALILLIVTTLMWGSWFQFSKRLNGYPVAGFVLLLYSFSFILVWTVIFCIKSYFIEEPLAEIIGENWKRCLLIILCGMIWSIGTQVNMRVIKNVGMILSTSITSTTGILLGTGISIYFGGLREGQSAGKILLGAAVLFAATIIGQFSVVQRDRDAGKVKDDQGYRSELKFRAKNLAALLVCSVFCTPFYNIAQSCFVQTDLKPDGIPQLVCIGFLSVGSFLGSLLISGTILTVNKQWRILFSNKKVVAMSAASAVCHYGGNLLYSLSAPILSHAIAWPIGTSFSFWQYVWGIGYGEYRRTSVKTKVMLGLAMAGFILGILVLC